LNIVETTAILEPAIDIVAKEIRRTDRARHGPQTAFRRAGQEMLNKWLIINNEDGYIVAGQVRETFGDGFILVWSPTCTGPPHMHLYDLAGMAESETLVFNSKDEMDAYIAWMEGPSTSKKGKVIKLHPKHGDE
jgi:hypothetical protein